jgi:hypothetical protein
MKIWNWLEWVLVVASLGAAGCGNKTAECNAVIDVFNKGAGTIQAVKDDDTEAPAKIGAAYTSTAAGLAKLTISTPELETIVRRMQSTATSAAAAANEVSRAPDKEAAGSKAATAIQAYNASAKDLQTFCGVEEKK